MTNTPRRLGVLGTFVWDTIWHPGGGGKPVEQWGGIAYSLAAMAAACPAGWRVEPIARIGADLEDEVFRFLETLPNLGSLAGVRVSTQHNNRVELRYVDAAERTERLTGGVTGWSPEALHPLLGELDALYVNFISGFELDLSTASLLRRRSIPLYADLHSLFLGPPGSGPRLPRPLADWRAWFESFDFVQLNATELSLLDFDVQRPHELSAALVGNRPAAVLVTRGSKAAVGIQRRAAPRLSGAAALPPQEGLRVSEVPPPRAYEGADPTGCGDIWGAVVFAALLGGLSIEEAMRRGHRAAAARLAVPRVESLVQSVGEALGGSRADA